MFRARAYGKLISFLLLVVFSCIQVVEAVHHHEPECSPSATGGTDYGDSQQANFEKLSINCDVCDYFLHTESKQLHSLSSVALVFFQPRPITLNSLRIEATVWGPLDNEASRGPPTAV